MDDQDVSLLVGGLVVGIVLGVLACLLILWPSRDSSGGTDHARLSGDVPVATPSVDDQPKPDQRQQCAVAADAMQRPLHRAAASMEQWQVHVGAMNKLVTGAISFQQATAFWNRTRVGAYHRIAAFERASAALRRRGLDCPAPAMVAAGAPRSLRACAHEVAADVQVLHLARVAIDTWRRHVHDMDMLRMGTLSPSDASRMWLSMWRRGQHQIDAYAEAVREARSLPGCRPGTPVSSPSATPTASPTG
jgi:hypothetical protein